MKFTSFFSGALIGLLGCGPVDPIDTQEDTNMHHAGSVAGEVTGVAGEIMIDDREPDQPPDPAFIDLYTPDVIIHPGEDKNLCVHVKFDGDDTGIRALEAHQGHIGHHLLLMSTDDPQPPGTLVDCDDPEELRHLRPVMYPTLALPADSGVRAIRLTKDMPLVLHFHNVNTGRVPVIVRDRARLTKVDPHDVAHWVSAIALTNFDFTLRPFAETTVDFDCVVPRDLDLLLIGGHMHEHGRAFSVSNLDPISLNLGSISPNEELRAEGGSVYSVDEWEPYFRDTPTIKPLFDHPRRLMKSSLLRVHCTWNNATDRWMIFPEEMCAVFGYVQEVTPAQSDPGGTITPDNGAPNDPFFCKAKSTSVEGAPL